MLSRVHVHVHVHVHDLVFQDLLVSYWRLRGFRKENCIFRESSKMHNPAMLSSAFFRLLFSNSPSKVALFFGRLFR